MTFGTPCITDDGNPGTFAIFEWPVPQSCPMTTIDFALEGDCIALCQLLKLTGTCDSGGRAKTLVADGRVRVDGQIETRKTCKIRAGQEVRLDDTLIRVTAAA